MSSLLLLSLLGPARAECPKVVAVAQLREAADGQLEAAASGQRFNVSQLDQTFRCLKEPISPDLALTMHLLHALSEAGATGSPTSHHVDAAREIAGGGQPLRWVEGVSPGTWSALNAAGQGSRMRLPDPPGGYRIMVDGSPTEAASSINPFYLQVLDSKGTLEASELITPPMSKHIPYTTRDKCQQDCTADLPQCIGDFDDSTCMAEVDNVCFDAYSRKKDIERCVEEMRGASYDAYGVADGYHNFGSATHPCIGPAKEWKTCVPAQIARAQCESLCVTAPTSTRTEVASTAQQKAILNDVMAGWQARFARAQPAQTSTSTVKVVVPTTPTLAVQVAPTTTMVALPTQAQRPASQRCAVKTPCLRQSGTLPDLGQCQAQGTTTYSPSLTNQCNEAIACRLCGRADNGQTFGCVDYVFPIGQPVGGPSTPLAWCGAKSHAWACVSATEVDCLRTLPVR